MHRMLCLSKTHCCFSRTHIQTNKHARTHTHTHITCLSTCLVNASCSCMMFYSCYQGYIHSWAIIFLCKPPVQVWLGLDNRKSAWRGDTTPQDVIKAIIALSRRDVQELRLWRRSRNTSLLGGRRNVCVPWCRGSRFESEVSESRRVTGGGCVEMLQTDERSHSYRCVVVFIEFSKCFRAPFCRETLEESELPWRSSWKRHHHNETLWFEAKNLQNEVILFPMWHLNAFNYWLLNQFSTFWRFFSWAKHETWWIISEDWIDWIEWLHPSLQTHWYISSLEPV